MLSRILSHIRQSYGFAFFVMLVQAEKDIECALDALESVGVLQHCNRMNLAELLNPAVKTHNLFDVTNQNIYDAVMEAKKLQDAEDSLGSANSAENSAHSDSDKPVDIILTHSEALQAAWGLQKYVEGLDTAYASNFTVMLHVFG
ncbi:hypothetical protein J3R82DRAFT_2072 [Butyriboletus roseoflavus]|nr:hypothetical protein J3R82DRAFT_2072 [Butyriboletus roseoflavus]